jgi:hypothetical protein
MKGVSIPAMNFKSAQYSVTSSSPIRIQCDIALKFQLDGRTNLMASLGLKMYPPSAISAGRPWAVFVTGICNILSIFCFFEEWISLVHLKTAEHWAIPRNPSRATHDSSIKNDPPSPRAMSIFLIQN